MPSQNPKPEALARQIVQALSTLSEGRPQVWRPIGELTGAISGADEAVQVAVDQGWLVIERGHRIRLTDEGRRLTTTD
jgi:hypothetical protein